MGWTPTDSRLTSQRRAASTSGAVTVCPPGSQCIVTSAPAFDSRSASRCASCGGIIVSLRPAPMNTAVPASAGTGSGSNGTIGLRRMAPLSTPGYRSSRLAAMLAPFENPTATMPLASRPYVVIAPAMNSFSSSVRLAKSSRSNTPSARRRKKRLAPRSLTLPRGLSIPAPGRMARPSGSRSDSSPPVPCSRSSVVPPASSAPGSGGMYRCTKPSAMSLTSSGP